MAAGGKPNKLVLAAVAAVHVTAAAITWRDLRSRAAGQVRGDKRIWRMASALNTLGSAAYWLLGRRQDADPLTHTKCERVGSEHQEVQMDHESATPYDDGGIVCDDQGLVIRRYYPWGAKRIRYTSIRGVKKLPLTGANKVRKWRIWGSGDFLHWWNLDSQRPKKDIALAIDVGHLVRPTITPDAPDAVERILTERITDR